MSQEGWPVIRGVKRARQACVYVCMCGGGGQRGDESPALAFVKSKHLLMLIFMNVDMDARLSKVPAKPLNIFSLIACCISAWVVIGGGGA